ncbi:enoyl-CoA hydratase/isomerase family protein [Chloroflexota bacterium]
MSAVLYEKEGQIGLITINRPEAMNALNPDAMEELTKIRLDFDNDPDLRVAIVTGSGDRAFCAGWDLKSAQITKEQRNAFAKSMDEIHKPIIAAVNGHALGGGLEIALGCDIRIAAENASFGLPEPRWGLMPGWGGTQRLPRAVPMGLALEMMLTARRISAEEALRFGLANRVVPLSELMPTAKKMAEEICQCGPLASRAVKEAAKRGVEMPLPNGLVLESKLLDELLKSEDAAEGAKAFQEKRNPEFKGK